MYKDLWKIAVECIEELEAINIQVGKILSFEINYTANRRWGQCCRKPNGWHTINISYKLLANDVDIKALKDTLFHELLHTCDGCMNHGTRWKNYADRVNKAYGYNIKRCTSAEEKNIEDDREKLAKYKFVCEDCGQVIYRQKASNFTKNYNLYTCGRCHGKFKRVF